MKKHLFSAIFLSLAITAIPALPTCLHGRAAAPAETAPLPEAQASEAAPLSSEPYKVLDAATGKVLIVPVREYVIGAVCAEMPANFGTEALKAQAVAAHTYAERQRTLAREEPRAELCGADFSNDTSKYQGYFTNEKIQQYFGKNYDEYYRRISAAADEVLPYVITYADEPIIAAFHSMSSGRTESAENAWGAPVDYLVPVDSLSDTKAPKYEETVRINKDELRDRLEAALDGIQLGEDMTKWLTVAEISDSGTVLTARAGDRTVTGNDIRTALGLRSADFDVTYDDEQAVITTRGFGHGVGMSQYGANAMASAGSTWREILAHYYPNCTIEEVKE
ncbi:stage II sporulation protein D [Ruminococcus sp. YRD2003]|uniref:stage II sporulation protein D n=1 Tax=Ruminococcus sp. YRD2003 TaxID=1452313 RepID=UPI0008C32BBD|nr:stage II sporulation protein D [Ruminococcus flavefaciens]